MQYAVFGEEKSSYRVAILVADIRRDEIQREYLTPFGLDPDEVIIIELHRSQGKKKTPVAEQKAYITEELGPVLNDLKVEYLLVADGDYFKVMSKASTVDKMLGYVLSTEFGAWKVIYLPNYRTVFYDPIKVREKITLGINALKAWAGGTYRDPGVDIIEFAEYPMTVEAIGDWLDRLIEMDCDLTIDIEGFSLKHYDCGIGTIAFAWSKTEGIAFPVDILDDPEHSRMCRELLRDFFFDFKRKATYHRIAFDVYVLIYQLFMKDLLDNAGLLLGLKVMLATWDCTHIISYLATNSTSGNKLSLKHLAQEYAGDYAVEEIKDIRKIPLPQLLQYNLVDTMATWFVKEKNWPKLVADNQLGIYQTIFQPGIVDIIQMQLTGMPMDMEQTQKVNVVLEGIREDAVDRMRSSQIVKSFRSVLANEWALKRNQELKKKRVTPSDYKEDFNPNSGPQLIKLLFDGGLGLPVLDLTDTKLPATGGKTLAKLINHTTDPEVKELLEALIDYGAVATILESFMPKFLNAKLGPDGWHWLFGYFNLGGTVSGRLSSSKPNLQNIPANVDMKLGPRLREMFDEILTPFIKDGKLSLGKLIKSCFAAPPGWFFCGIDFSSLEDRISALTTKDPNKLKVYTDGYDGHCLRAYAYFGDQMPDIDPTTVAGINEIDGKYKDLRQKSKNPTFALTYDGDYGTLMRNYGFTEELARKCEESYKELYATSVAWVKAKKEEACKVGYGTIAFGLRIRTPMLHQVVLGTKKTPYQAEAEGRTLGNALGQSWCLLNTRAGSEFMGKVRASEFRLAIKPCAQIHDAQYYLVRDDIDAMHYVNTYVVEACQWQNDPEIWHDEVKLGGEFSVFWPTWAKEAVIPNYAPPELIRETFEKHVMKLTA